MAKENTMYIHNGILFSHEKEGNPAMNNNMAGPWGYYTKWNKSDKQKQIPYDLIYMWNLKETELVDTRKRSVVARHGD